MNARPIYKLPTLSENQEWACEHGCSNVKPNLYRNVYSQSWDKQGNLLEEQAEHFYTCGCNHLLMVWDNKESDYAQLDESFHKEAV
jgi:hypothetical protein